MIRTLALLLVLVAPLASRAEPTLVLPSRASVGGDTIRLAEIAALDALPPELAQPLEALELGASAEPGHARVFPGEALRRRILAALAQAGSSLPLRIEAPLEVAVHTAYRPITRAWLQARVREAIELRMPWPSEAVSLLDWRVPDDFAVPVAATLLEVHFRPDEDFLGPLRAQLVFRVPNRPETSARRHAGVSLAVRRPVAVLRSDVRRGRPLEAHHVRMETRDLRKLPRDVITDLDAALGQPLKRNLPKGTALSRAALQRAPLVKRGDNVSVELWGDALELQIEARATEAGALGDTIRLENPSTRQRFLAVVVDSGRARMAQPHVGTAP